MKPFYESTVSKLHGTYGTMTKLTKKPFEKQAFHELFYEFSVTDPIK